MTRNEQIEMATLQRQAARLVEREVHACMSSVIFTLSSASHFIDGGRGTYPALDDIRNLAEQAFELARPITDYEEAAREAGWSFSDGAWRHEDGLTGSYKTVEGLCECEVIEPYDREVFEHWAVSSWLADKLEAKGEKVDRDFAGLCVWARTTTGQAISIDTVIGAIVKETGYASHPATDAA